VKKPTLQIHLPPKLRLLFPVLMGLFWLVPALVAQTTPAASTLRFGLSNGWKDFPSLTGIGFERARDGFLDLTLQAAEYTGDDNTDMLFHFNDRLRDDASRYQAATSTAPDLASVIKRGFAALGGGSAVFRGDNPVVLQATPGALFSAKQGWGDFTVEFWLYPSEVQDGESVLKWQGGRTSSGAFETQLFQVSFAGSRLVWTLQNLFATTPSAKAVTIQLSGDKTLIPRQWHHHLLRYQASTGLLEYTLDGLTEALTHATPSATEDGQVYGLVTGSQTKGEVVLGDKYNGALDELRMSRDFVDSPQTDRYLTGFATKGTAISRIFDLRFAGSFIETITARATRAGDTALVYSYRMAETIRYQWNFDGTTDKSLAQAPEEEQDSWTRFEPGDKLFSGLSGRYLQLRIDLLPSGTGKQTPRLTELTVNASPNLPPPSPSGLEVTAGNGTLELRWKPVMQGKVDGYLVFFGTRPGQYLDTKSNQGASPLKLGNVTSVTLSGLANDQIYYVSVATYQATNISVNSRELASRPSRDARKQP